MCAACHGVGAVLVHGGGGEEVLEEEEGGGAAGEVLDARLLVEACPVSTGGGTRRVGLVREGRGGGLLVEQLDLHAPVHVLLHLRGGGGVGG